MRNILTIIFILLLFIGVNAMKKYDSMQAMNHEMVERCTIDMAINPDLICD